MCRIINFLSRLEFFLEEQWRHKKRKLTLEIHSTVEKMSKKNARFYSWDYFFFYLHQATKCFVVQLFFSTDSYFTFSDYFCDILDSYNKKVSVRLFKKEICHCLKFCLELKMSSQGRKFASSQVRKFASFHKKEIFTTHFYFQGRSTTKYAVTSWLSIRLY